MATATCKCPNGHKWTTCLIADEPDVNACEVLDGECPECGRDDIEVIDVEYDDEEPYA